MKTFSPRNSFPYNPKIEEICKDLNLDMVMEMNFNQIIKEEGLSYLFKLENYVIALLDFNDYWRLIFINSNGRVFDIQTNNGFKIFRIDKKNKINFNIQNQNSSELLFSINKKKSVIKLNKNFFKFKLHEKLYNSYIVIANN